MSKTNQPTLERDLLLRLGLSEGASEDEVETAHGDVVAFLEDAPSDLRGWARLQIAAADEAYALLSDPTGLARRQRELPDSQPAAQPIAATPSRRQRTMRPAAVEQTAPRPRIGRFGRVLIGVAALVGVLAVGYVVYASDLPTVPGLTGTPAPEGNQATLDTARVAQLMQTIQSNPNDIAALQELGDLYYGANDYGVAAEWEQKILDIDPNNITAHLAIGAANYNLGNSADAETHWRKVIELNPADTEAIVEAHYDLGFMYFSADPPDVEKTIAEWQAVIDIAPDSDIAQTVSTHLATLEGWNASASPSSSTAPAASGSPAVSPTPAASPRPAATATPAVTAAP